MKVDSTELPPRQVSLAIEVEQERVDRAMDEAYRRLAGQVDVPGFRRGRAPRPMVERLIGRDRIMQEAIDHLLPVVVTEAMEQEKVEPYTRPRVESIEFDPLRVKAVVGLAPKVELGNYKGQLKVPAEEANVDQKEVDDYLNRLRDNYAQWAPVERAVQVGDRVGIDLRATVADKDKPIQDSKDAEYIVDTDGVRPAPGFAAQLIGLEAGADKTFSLDLPEDYPQTEVAGQPAEFRITLHWVKERQLPELDDEFAQQMGDYADVAALRTAVESDLRTREENRVREKLEDAAMTRLVEISSIEFPPQLVEHEAQHMLETISKNFEQQGIQLPQYLRMVGKEQETFEEEIRAQAQTRVARSLALDAFADAEKIGVEDQEIEDEVRRAAAGRTDSEAVERLALQNPSTRARVEEVTRERKARERLLELATGNGRAKGKEKATQRGETPDTERQRRKSSPSPSETAESEEEQESA
ncbi:MAG TPA: trigger factor [Chloroflexota bacterium]